MIQPPIRENFNSRKLFSFDNIDFMDSAQRHDEQQQSAKQHSTYYSNIFLKIGIDIPT